MEERTQSCGRKRSLSDSMDEGSIKSEEIPSKLGDNDRMRGIIKEHMVNTSPFLRDSKNYNTFVRLTLKGVNMLTRDGQSEGWKSASREASDLCASKFKTNSGDIGAGNASNFTSPFLMAQYRSKKIEQKRSSFHTLRKEYEESKQSSNTICLSNQNSLFNNGRREVVVRNYSRPPISQDTLRSNFTSELINREQDKVTKSIFALPKGSSDIQPSSKKVYTMEKGINLQEREQYRLLLEQFSQNRQFFSYTIPAKKNLHEWNLSLKCSNKDASSVEKENVAHDENEPLILKVMPRQHGNLSLGDSKHKVFSPEWLQELKRSLDLKNEETLKSVRDKERQIKAYEEKQAARRALYLKQLLGDKRADHIEILVLPEFTLEMQKVIDMAYLPHSPNEVAFRGKDSNLLYRDINTLMNTNWLNDEVINQYMTLISERSTQPGFPKVHVFTTFFYPKLKQQGHTAIKRWTKKIDIFSYDINLIPMHLDVHWCLGVIDHRYKKIQYYDSMNGKENCLSIFKNYLSAESLDKKKANFDSTGWDLEVVQNIPPQLNGSDCGMFTLKYAEYITRNAEINFTQEHIQYFRKKMICELIAGKIM